jgi:serine/threonine protein kinase
MATIVLPRGNLTPTSASPLSTMTPSSSNQMSPPPLSSGIGGNLQRHDARPPLHVQPNCDTSPLMSSYSANPCMPLSAKPSPAGCCHTGAGSNHSLLGFGDNTSLAAGLSPMRSHVDMLGLVSPAPFGNASLKLHAMDAMPASISANSSNAGFGLALDNLIPIGQQPESPNMPPLPLAATLQFDYVGPSGRGSRRPSGPSDGRHSPLLRLNASAFCNESRFLRSSIIGIGSTAAVTLTADCETGRTFAEKNVPIPSGEGPVIPGNPRASGRVEHDFAKRFLGYISEPTRNNVAADEIPGVVGVFHSRVMHCNLTLLMEHMDAGDAARYTPMEKGLLAAVTRQVLEGLRVLHTELFVIHRDLKPENILLKSTGDAKIADYGCAALLDGPHDFAMEQVGTILQMPPERLRGEAHGFVSDIWSLGVTIAQLAAGRHPFLQDAAVLATQERFWLLAEVLRFTGTDEECAEATAMAVEFATADMDADVAAFVKACLATNPRLRPSVDDLLQFTLVHGISVEDARTRCREKFEPCTESPNNTKVGG